MLAHKEKKIGRWHDIQNGGRGISWQAHYGLDFQKRGYERDKYLFRTVTKIS